MMNDKYDNLIKNAIGCMRTKSTAELRFANLSMVCGLSNRRCSTAACSCTLCTFSSEPTVAERYSHSRHVPAAFFLGN